MTGIRMVEVQTAKAWGKLPSEFDSLSEEDRAWMMALGRTEGGMRGYDAYRAEERRKTAERRTKRGSRGHH